MPDFLLAHEKSFRLLSFLTLFIVLCAWEFLSPRRVLSVPKIFRWPNNLALAFLDTLLLRLLFPASAVGMAYLSHEKGWGILNHWSLTPAASILISIVVLDLVIYFQHRLFHSVPLFWRIHRMHHTDLDLDVTSGVRFHPIEILSSLFIKQGSILLIGPPAVAVLLFEVILNTTSLFNHSNVRMVLTFDRFLRWIVVTPDMHRVHHSTDWRETNSNFGFNFPWWDRLWKTYQAQPSKDHEKMTIGLKIFRKPVYLRLDWLLRIPFMGKKR
jgi:sterol desaturase/sphingolipid hydroxylase (fatty acid hydroxylase superfamily)